MKVQHEETTNSKGDNRIPRRIPPNNQSEGCEAGEDKYPHMPTPKPTHLLAWIRIFVHMRDAA
jgi:hypothetical protein